MFNEIKEGHEKEAREKFLLEYYLINKYLYGDLTDLMPVGKTPGFLIATKKTAQCGCRTVYGKGKKEN
ncbi:MAG TPA: hypothetical protein VKB95_06320 [Chitinophagaceae bacterium]|nr:hypothetical protein [Chitinophagaceae bacterium]